MSVKTACHMQQHNGILQMGNMLYDLIECTFVCFEALPSGLILLQLTVYIMASHY